MKDTEFIAFLGERKQAVSAEIESLTKDGRKDEANILKAKLNIFDVCKSVFEALFKQHPEGIETVFPATFERITAPWEASLSKAKEHGDDRKVLIEEAKLSAVTEINARFAELS